MSFNPAPKDYLSTGTQLRVLGALPFVSDSPTFERFSE